MPVFQYHENNDDFLSIPLFPVFFWGVIGKKIAEGLL